MSPSRRHLLQRVGAGLIAGVAGCTARPADDPSPEPTETEPTATPTPVLLPTGTYANKPDGPTDYPERPDQLTRETVVEYAKQFEYARTKNVLHEPNIEESSVESKAIYDTASAGGHYAIATASGYANYSDGVHADWGQLPAFYFLAPELTVRIEDLADQYFHCTDVFAAEDPEKNFAEVCEGGDASYRVYNFRPEFRDLTVTVEFLGEDGDQTADPTPVLEREYGLRGTFGLKQGSVTYRRGVYRLTATLDDGTETAYRWELFSEPTYEDPPVSVIIDARGDLRVRRPPFPEL
jgi:hypothetical protein